MMTRHANPEPLVVQGIYLVELCSGEQRQWQYLGKALNGDPLWLDVERRETFAEGGLMYAWQVVRRER